MTTGHTPKTMMTLYEFILIDDSREMTGTEVREREMGNDMSWPKANSGLWPAL